ncbi:class II aldolase/adducin family protein, partial [Paenibacillus xylanexedens]|uniref:class II aldolase/adducin family protein n=1 Tax=Paenibacillus xylanexedens TaxID=528191 RepID=UPI0016427BC4
GNLTTLDRQSRLFLIKPSPLHYEKIKPTHILLLHLHANLLQPHITPSSHTTTHPLLYNHFNHIPPILHTHSTSPTISPQP